MFYDKKNKVGKTGKVVGIEHMDELVLRSIENIKKWNHEALESKNLKLIGINLFLSINIFYSKITFTTLNSGRRPQRLPRRSSV